MRIKKNKEAMERDTHFPLRPKCFSASSQGQPIPDLRLPGTGGDVNTAPAPARDTLPGQLRLRLPSDAASGGGGGCTCLPSSWVEVTQHRLQAVATWVSHLPTRRAVQGKLQALGEPFALKPEPALPVTCGNTGGWRSAQGSGPWKETDGHSGQSVSQAGGSRPPGGRTGR